MQVEEIRTEVFGSKLEDLSDEEIGTRLGEHALFLEAKDDHVTNATARLAREAARRLRARPAEITFSTAVLSSANTGELARQIAELLGAAPPVKP